MFSSINQGPILYRSELHSCSSNMFLSITVPANDLMSLVKEITSSDWNVIGWLLIIRAT